MAAYTKNHVISECLLKRFADEDGKILIHGRNEPIPYKTQGFRKSLWQPEAKKMMENLWSDQAEGDMADVFKKIDARKQLNAEERSRLCKFMAIHFIRSNKFIKEYEKLRMQKANTVSFSQNSFYERYQQRLRWMKDSEIPCKFFENVMREYYYACADYLSKFGFEIGVAEEGEFVLPDCGLVLGTYDAKDIQPDGNIELLQATSAALPLGPKHLVAFTSRTRRMKYTYFSRQEVQNANKVLKLATIKTYYCRPA